MGRTHSKFQCEVLNNKARYKCFTQLSNTCVCGIFDDNFCKMLTKSKIRISNELLFKCEEIKSGFIRQVKHLRAQNSFKITQLAIL